MNGRSPSWHATGLVEKAWKRISPPTRDELARRMGVEGADLSQRNNSTPTKKRPRPMTFDYAVKIAAAVRTDDPTFTVADLGAPTSAVVEADPTVLDRLEELAAAVGLVTLKVDAGLEILNERLSALETQAARRAKRAPAASPRKRKAV